MKPPPLAVRLEKALPFLRIGRARARAPARARPDSLAPRPVKSKTDESFLRKRIGHGHEKKLWIAWLFAPFQGASLSHALRAWMLISQKPSCT